MTTLIVAALVIVALVIAMALFSGGGENTTGTAPSPAAIEGVVPPVGATPPAADPMVPTGVPGAAPPQ
jgi:hypothetical protein